MIPYLVRSGSFLVRLARRRKPLVPRHKSFGGIRGQRWWRLLLCCGESCWTRICQIQWLPWWIATWTTSISISRSFCYNWGWMSFFVFLFKCFCDILYFSTVTYRNTFPLFLLSVLRFIQIILPQLCHIIHWFLCSHGVHFTRHNLGIGSIFRPRIVIT